MLSLIAVAPGKRQHPLLVTDRTDSALRAGGGISDRIDMNQRGNVITATEWTAANGAFSPTIIRAAWMDSRAAATYLGRKKKNAYKTLERYAREGTIPAHFRFGQWNYLKEELDAWMQGGVSSGSQSVRVN